MPARYQPTTNEGQPLTKAQARALTDLINQQGESLCKNITDAHDRKAWEALGYDSWKDYVTGELRVSEQQAFRLLTHEKTLKVLQINPTDSPIGESVTRELAKVPDEKKAEVFAVAVAKTPGKAPTAKAVRAVVDEIQPPARKARSDDEPDANELQERLDAVTHELDEKQRDIDSLSAEDGKKELAVTIAKFHAVNGRVQQQQTTMKEMESEIKYCKGLLAKIRSVLSVEKNSEIMPALMGMMNHAS